MSYSLFGKKITIDAGIESLKYCDIGFYLLWIGIICLIAHAFLRKKYGD